MTLFPADVAAALLAIGVAALTSAAVTVVEWLRVRRREPETVTAMRWGGVALVGGCAAGVACQGLPTLWHVVMLGILVAELVLFVACTGLLYRVSQQGAFALMHHVGLVPWLLAGGLLYLVLDFQPALATLPGALLGALIGAAPLLYRQLKPALLAPYMACELALAIAVLLLLSLVTA